MEGAGVERAVTCQSKALDASLKKKKESDPENEVFAFIYFLIKDFVEELILTKVDRASSAPPRGCWKT